MRSLSRRLAALAPLVLAACFDTYGPPPPSGAEPPAAGAEEGADPAAIAIGERLFQETRFAQVFAAHASGINKPLASGDPVLDATATTAAALPGPIAGQSMNCTSCHLVDQQFGVAGGGMRSYTDFARRSPIPERGDGQTAAPRSSPPLVDATLVGASALVPADSQALVAFLRALDEDHE